VTTSFQYSLEECGYRVTDAHDGCNGIALFREQRPDLILLDIQMPGMNRLEILEIIHAEDSDLPVVMVSATGEISFAATAINLGACSYLRKPVTDLAILQHTVKKELEEASLIHENRQYRKDLEELIALHTVQLEDVYGEPACQLSIRE
jgi:DNA-binding NtrC family response regulator